jgi:signal peptidase
LWKNEYFRTILTILLVVVIVVGFWYGLRWGLNTNYPVLAVASGSMSVAQPDPGWASPFSPTLHTGDLIIVEGIKPQDVYAAPYNPSGRSGDILVFHAIDSDELIVHRAIGTTVVDGEIYFITKGDGNAVSGPSSPTPPENVVGKVVLRIPWLGYIALDIRNSTALLIIVVLIIAFIIIESVVSEIEHKRTNKSENAPEENLPEPESRG